MDPILIEYLKSGEAWVFLGSGLSIASGLPTWKSLAEEGILFVSSEGYSPRLELAQRFLNNKEYKDVFSELVKLVGDKALVSHLNSYLSKSQIIDSKVYSLLANWPIPVYLTTNYDDLIHTYLVKIGEAYKTYTNSPDHMSILTPDLNGAIYKLHGDLTSTDRLILTGDQYDAIENSNDWDYWRIKMLSIFTMCRVIIIGHSLTDPHINHILKIAKKASHIGRPICWITEGTTLEQRKEYSNLYNIRVIPYDNRDKEHKCLINYIERTNLFIPSRNNIGKKRTLFHSHSAIQKTDSSIGFYVFNQLLKLDDFDTKRIKILLSAIQGKTPDLINIPNFQITDALISAGWPPNMQIPEDLIEQIANEGIRDDFLIYENGRYKVKESYIKKDSEQRLLFNHMKERFLDAVILKIKKYFNLIPDEKAKDLANEIESSLSASFKESGLIIASNLFSKNPLPNTLPLNLLKVISDHSNMYDDILMRQAFIDISLRLFTEATTAEKDYLGRLSQGYFGFQSIGAFGNYARIRVEEAKNTLWLIDSNAQIRALALSSRVNDVFVNCFRRLHSMGIRLFSTVALFNETKEHLRFAQSIIDTYGQSSPHIYWAARGESPYQKSNVFLEGYIFWQNSGNPNDWEEYLFSIFKCRKPTEIDLRNTLGQLGIEVIDFKIWPGYQVSDEDSKLEFTAKIVEKIELIGNSRINNGSIINEDDITSKAKPEAEALIIIEKERNGEFYINSDIGVQKQAWFISDTAMLNMLGGSSPYTWQTSSFIKFASTLFPDLSVKLENQAFETILLELAQSGVMLLEDKVIEEVFSKEINDSSVSIENQLPLYREISGKKYSERPEAVDKRLRKVYAPTAAVQLSELINQMTNEALKSSNAEVVYVNERLKKAEEELNKVKNFKLKLERKQNERKRKKRKQKMK
jgi:hypothetical protein